MLLHVCAVLDLTASMHGLGQDVMGQLEQIRQE